LTKLTAIKVGAGVVYDQIGGTEISIKPTSTKSLPGGFCRYIFQKSGGGKSCSLINNVEYWLAVNVEDIDEYRVIKVQIVRKLELESVWGFAVLLTMATVFG
jgi:hypothetical protein